VLTRGGGGGRLRGRRLDACLLLCAWSKSDWAVPLPWPALRALTHLAALPLPHEALGRTARAAQGRAAHTLWAVACLAELPGSGAPPPPGDLLEGFREGSNEGIGEGLGDLPALHGPGPPNPLLQGLGALQDADPALWSPGGPRWQGHDSAHADEERQDTALLASLWRLASEVILGTSDCARPQATKNLALTLLALQRLGCLPPPAGAAAAAAKIKAYAPDVPPRQAHALSVFAECLASWHAAGFREGLAPAAAAVQEARECLRVERGNQSEAVQA